MTLNGAIMQLVEMRENSMMPEVFKPYFDKVIETVSECEDPSMIPERKKGTPLLEKREWIEGYQNRWYRKKLYCASCGIKIKTESWDEKRCFGEGTILKDNNMPNFCPNCGAWMEGQDEL